MAVRIIAIALLVLTLGIVAAFLLVVLIPPREEPRFARAPSVAQSEAATPDRTPFTGTLGPWRVEGKLEIASSGTYQLTFSLVGEDGEPPPASATPTVLVDMTDHAMEPALSRVEAAGRGMYRTAGNLEMDGRWHFRIALGDSAVGVTADFGR